MKINNASLPRWVTRRDPLFRPDEDEERYLIEERNDIENGI
jgi:hypothetical protein